MSRKPSFHPDRPPVPKVPEGRNLIRTGPEIPSSQTIHVVGNIFCVFASRHEEVITIAELEQKLSAGTPISPQIQTILIGQGVPREAIDLLQARLEALGLNVEVLPPPADRRATHKQKAVNRLISTPMKVGDSQYELDLVIDERTADLANHTSGEQVAGMILLEASRQTLLAVLEADRPEDDHSYVVILHDLVAQWKSFVFPLPTRIRADVYKERDLAQGDATFVAETRFHQADERPAAIMRWRYSAFDACFIADIEEQKATQVIWKMEQARSEKEQ